MCTQGRIYKPVAVDQFNRAIKSPYTFLVRVLGEGGLGVVYLGYADDSSEGLVTAKRRVWTPN